MGHAQSIKMDIKTKQEFVQWVKRAVSTSDDCYIELYNLLLRCYVAADVDMDGKVDGGEFSGMIEAAAALPKQHGQSWWEEEETRGQNCSRKLMTMGTAPSPLTSGSRLLSTSIKDWSPVSLPPQKNLARTLLLLSARAGARAARMSTRRSISSTGKLSKLQMLTGTARWTRASLSLSSTFSPRLPRSWV